MKAINLPNSLMFSPANTFHYKVTYYLYSFNNAVDFNKYSLLDTIA